MKKTFWKTDWFLGISIVVVFVLAGSSDLIQSLERKAYDFAVGLSGRPPSDKVAVIAIDDYSISNIGRWPWPRDVHAKAIDLLAAAGPKAIGNTILYPEPQMDPGLAHITRLQQLFNASRFRTVANADLQAEAKQFDSLLKEAEQGLNADRKLADALGRAGNVALGMQLQLGQPAGKPDKPLPDYLGKSSLTNVKDRIGAEKSELLPYPAAAVTPPIPAFGDIAAGVGHIDANLDVDGGRRAEPLVVRYYDRYFPSLSLMLAAKSLNLSPADIEVRLGEGVKMGNLTVATDSALRMYTRYYRDRDGKPAFQVDSFYDVLSGKIPPSKYKDKIVLIGATAGGVGTAQVTPVSAQMAPVVTMAHAVSSILNQDYYTVPSWGFWAELAVFLLVAAYLIVLLPHLSAGAGAAVTGLIFAVLLGAHFGLMTLQAVWLQFMLPAVMLLTGHGLLTTKRYLMTERGKEKSDAESAESNRMLGLAFQGQGQLDMAFDKFRKCPLDDSMMDLLYNLALDFERKRQFNKAASVFEYISGHNAGFRDVKQRIQRSNAMSETVILGGGSTRGNASTLILDNAALEKPMLGRYQVEKELGKGAMGVVYLGRDPKISRVVAIKTMALSQEFEGDELTEVKERFFREAETAGRLNHPNIVTIYDAGEEQDLAYIAMEFLKGQDLMPYTKPGNLLPLQKVISIVARVADALNYAHVQHIVHRDIKPANIMYEPETDTLKVTDFGIARITDSSKTKTGMVLGTPSYMSPEQLSGQKVDGRSDLFSLGVMFYQLVSGQLPFQGDSMAQLMFRIANDPPQDILTLNPKLSPCVAAIIRKVLAKQPEKRYQTGAELAHALNVCGQLCERKAEGA